MYRTLLCLLLLWLPATRMFAQEDEPGFATNTSSDTAKPIVRSDPGWQYASEMLMGEDSFYRWDSSFVYVHRYNRAVSNAVPVADLGTTASPHRLLHVNPLIPTGFYSGLNLYPLYHKSPDSFRFYRARVPLSRFYYTQGGNGVFVFEALHTQNIRPNWNITVDFSSVQNGEIYINSKQNHLHRAIAAGSHFQSKNKRYVQQFIFTWNNARRNENRGLESDSFFYWPENFTADSGLIRTTPQYVPASATASSVSNQRHHRLEQQYALGENRTLYLFHRFDWIKERYQYEETSTLFSDQDSLFYGSPVFQDGPFKDSSVWAQWNNSFGIFSPKNLLHWPLRFKAWYSLDRMAWNTVYKLSPNLYLNQSAHFQVQTGNMASPVRTSLHFSQYFSGRNAGDYLADIAIRVRDRKPFSWNAALRSQRSRAPFIAERFSGNYFTVHQELKPVYTQSARVEAIWKNRMFQISSGAFAILADNHLYNDTSGNFAQTGLRAVGLRAAVKIRLGRWVLDNRITWQQHNRAELLPYPVFSDLLGLYYEGPMFKKALKARFGVDVWYTTSYTGYRFQPMYGVFYPGSEKTGNYPWADACFSGEIKTLMFFLKMEHINQTLMNYGFNNRFNSAIGYPGEPLRFRFGFIWRFYN